MAIKSQQLKYASFPLRASGKIRVLPAPTREFNQLNSKEQETICEFARGLQISTIQYDASARLSQMFPQEICNKLLLRQLPSRNSSSTRNLFQSIVSDETFGMTATAVSTNVWYDPKHKPHMNSEGKEFTNSY